MRLSVSPRTLRKLVIDPEDPLPAYRIRGKLLFDWAEVRAWVKNHRVRVADMDADVQELLSMLDEDTRKEND